MRLGKKKMFSPKNLTSWDNICSIKTNFCWFGMFLALWLFPSCVPIRNILYAYFLGEKHKWAILFLLREKSAKSTEVFFFLAKSMATSPWLSDVKVSCSQLNSDITTEWTRNRAPFLLATGPSTVSLCFPHQKREAVIQTRSWPVPSIE